VSGGLHIQLLGEFGLAYDGARVGAVNTPRLRTLLAYLILHRCAPQPRQHLAFLLWPDSDEEQARTNLRNLVHLLRHALPHSDCCLHSEGQTLLWEPHVLYDLDVTEFEEAIHSGAQQRAIELYRGDLLPDCYGDWIIPERERLRLLYLGALQQAVGEQETAQNYGVALGYAQRLVREEPLSEAYCRQLIRLQMLNGDRATALRTYHACATALRRELGVDPALATQQLHAEILEGVDKIPAQLLPAAPSEPHLPLVGRSSEWNRLWAAWGSAASGRAQFALIKGDVGIGKTRLAEELLDRTQRQGFPTARTACHKAEGCLPYSPVIAWLRSRPLPRLGEAWQLELAHLLPDAAGHALPDLHPCDAPWERHRLFEALAHAIQGWTATPAPCETGARQPPLR
jgi:DNA-binding SARP family transcriptional activator